MFNPGIAFVLFCAATASLKDLASKRLAFQLDGLTSAFASFLFALPYYAVILLVLWILGYEDFAHSRIFFFYVILRSISDTAAEWLKMSSYRFGDISLVSIVFSMQPLIIVVFFYLFLNERPTALALLGIVVIVLGTLLLALEKPFGEQERKLRSKAILLSFLSTICFSVNSIFDRLAVQEGSPVWSACTMTLLSGLFLAPLPLLQSHRREALVLQKGLLFRRGFLEVLAMTSKLLALRYLEVAYVAGLQKLSTLFSVIGGRFLYGEKGFSTRFIASAVIFLGAFLILIGR